MDVIIITMNKSSQAAYWQAFFDQQDQIKKHFIIIHEDWPGGAGNGLGSLYAFIKANKIAQKKLGIDLLELLRKRKSIGLFHCAGMGKRLYPLTASEYNNKSAIKIPAAEGYKSVIENLLQQTIPQVDHIKGRLFVFWGDQLFLPSQQLQTPSSHVEIFSQVIPIPTEQEWKNRGLEKYGLIILPNGGNAQLVEKIHYPKLMTILAKNHDVSTTHIGLSLGSFSISPTLLNLLIETFDHELQSKTGRLNTDYHFWMPLTWKKKPYQRFMVDKGYNHHFVTEIYDKMQAIKKALEEKDERNIFGVQDIGEDAYWWDLGGLKNYFYHLLSLVSNRPKGLKFLEMLGIENFYDRETNSILINCDIQRLDVKNSVLVNVVADEVYARDSVIMNSTYKKLNCQYSLSYNVKEKQPTNLSHEEVRADIFYRSNPKQVIFYTHITRNGKDDWEVKLPKNSFAYHEISQINEQELPLTYNLPNVPYQ
jgi:hypothetical protein